ncbi:MAG: hypothetical protein FJX56_13760 [Alphaproteobacteria bacterium]|nr:hypothetical protein [Alphaproteobacteria bacterium]
MLVTDVGDSAGVSAMAFIIEFWQFLRVRRRYWLLPILIVAALFGGVVVLSQGTVIGPFLCTVF